MSGDAVTRVSVEIAGSEISFETGRMAKQASGAVVVRQGDTMVLATAVAGAQRDVDFLPLTVDGNFVVNPREEDLAPAAGEAIDAEGGSDLDLVVAGTEEAILMVEAGANEIPEAEILDALDIAHEEIKKLCALQRELAARVGKVKIAFESTPVDEELVGSIRASHGQALDEATQVEDKLERQEATAAVEEAVLEQYAPAPAEGA